MTSTKLVRGEIEKFLQSSNPEVLCITGEWGVGKTYTWKAILKSVADKNALALKKYSYVSLFGLNSLADLKLTVAENLQILQPEDKPAKESVWNFATNKAFGSVKYLKGFTSAIPYIGKAISESGQLYFSLIVNEQIVCVDDLDRAGSGLRVEDVLGLISSLKEEHGCKIVLLLNEEQLGTGRETFKKLVEKVIDSQVVFAPTAAEAVAIALTETDETNRLIGENCTMLGISNIRVIKKIERLVRAIEPIISKRSKEVLAQTIHTLTVLGWSRFQPDVAPPLSFFSVSSMERYISKKKMSEQESAWTALIDKYNFGHLDQYDAQLLKYVKLGVLDEGEIDASAAQQDEEIGRISAIAALESGYRAYHDSFADNAEAVANGIKESLEQNLKFVGIKNLDVAVMLLKKIRRKQEAKELLSFFKANQNDKAFWNAEKNPFDSSISDPDVQVVAEKIRATHVVEFDPIAELIKASKSLNSEKIAKLATLLTPDFLVDAINSRSGEEMRHLIYAGLEFRSISNASEDMKKIVDVTIEALAQIGSQSELNRARVSAYGVDVPAIVKKAKKKRI